MNGEKRNYPLKPKQPLHKLMTFEQFLTFEKNENQARKINSVQDLIDYLEFVCEQLESKTYIEQYYLLFEYNCEYGLCALCRYIIFKENNLFIIFLYDYLTKVFGSKYMSNLSISSRDNFKFAIQLRIDWLKENQDKIENSFKKYDTEN